MVTVPESMMHGQASKKPNHEVLRPDETIESIKHALALRGIDSSQSFAFIALGVDGKARVHTSGQVKGFLDEQSLGSGFEQAYEKAVHEPFIVPEPASAISTEDGQGSDYGGDEFPLIPQTFGTTKETEPVREPTPSEPEEEVVKPKKIDKSLRIDDTEHVEEFLKMRLRRMQQLAVKKIAKAWIKGICPKKQAKFPYQNKRGEERDGFKPRVPGWWPDTRDCRFIEPDHIRRDERMRLCLHLLRLRPTPGQLKEWNEDKSEPRPVHVERGWTAFLQELAGVSIFEELQKEDKKRTETKKDLLREMYEVAGLEEQYFNDEIDGDTRHCWEEVEEERRMASAKRPAQQPIDFDVEQASRQSSESVECRRAKRSRRNSILDGAFSEVIDPQFLNADTTEQPSSEGQQQVIHSNALFEVDTARHDPAPVPNSTGQFISNDHGSDRHDAAPSNRDSSPHGQWRHFEPQQGRWVDNVAASNQFPSPANNYVMQTHYQGTPQAPPSFPGDQGYGFPQHEQPSMVQVHQVNQIPEPHFQPVSSAPVYSPGGMIPVPLGNFVPQDCNPPAHPQQFANNMAPNPYFLPANGDPSVGEFFPPMPQHYHDQHGLASRHIAPMQIHGLPFTQPSGWDGKPFNGHCHNPT